MRLDQSRRFEEQLLKDLSAHVARRAELASAVRRPERRAPLRGRRLVVAFGLALVLPAAGLLAQNLGASDQPLGAANASEILILAANAAEQEPELTARLDQYVFTEVLTKSREPATGSVRAVRVQMWQSAGGVAHTQVRHRPDSEPNAWSELAVMRPDDPADPGRLPSPAFHGGLPTDADELLRHLRRHPVQLHLPEGADAEAVYEDERMPYATARSLLQGYLPPKTLAALFELLAREPGAIVVAGDVPDATGRPGVAVRMPGTIGGSHDLIFDRSSHRYLGYRLLHDGEETPELTSALLRVGIVDEPGELPDR